MTEVDRVLYLAVPLETFTSFFQERFIQTAVKLHQIRLVIYDLEEEVITKWKD
jgi:XisH protein